MLFKPSSDGRKDLIQQLIISPPWYLINTYDLYNYGGQLVVKLTFVTVHITAQTSSL